MQLPCQPWRSPPWSTCSLGALLDAPCGQGRSASTASAWRSSFLCRSAWCRVLLLSLPPSSSEPSCSPCWIASSLEPRWTLPVVEVNRPPLPAPGRCAAAPSGHPRSLRANASPGQLARFAAAPPRHPRSLRANASPGQLACLPRPLSAQPRLLPAIHRNPPRPLLVGARPSCFMPDSSTLRLTHVFHG